MYSIPTTNLITPTVSLKRKRSSTNTLTDRSKLPSPSNDMDNYQDSYLNVPIMSRDRASPSVGSIQSDPESCLDGYFMDDDDTSLYGWFELLLIKLVVFGANDKFKVGIRGVIWSIL